MSQKIQNEVKMVPFSSIEINEEENARSELKDIDKLAENIKEHGLLEPLGVTNGGSGDKPYRLRFGSRRAAALKKLKWGDAPVAVTIVPAEDSILTNLMENLQRQDLPTIDLAQRLHDLEAGEAPGTDGKKYTKVELAKIINRSQSHVGNLIRAIKNLGADARRVWRSKDVPTTVVFAWAGMDEEAQSAAVAAYKEEQERIDARISALAGKEEAAESGGKKKRKKDKGEDGPQPLVKGKNATQLETNAAILNWKIEQGIVKSKEEVAEAMGQIMLIRFLLGDLARFPSISASERKDYAKWLKEQQAEVEGEEEEGEE